MGWVWVASLLQLKGWRKALGVGFAAIYCLRTHLMLSMGTADAFIYAVAPWLIGAAFVLSSQSRLRVTGRLIAWTTVLSLACGAVYWVKYSGILMGIAIVGAVSLTQLLSKARPRLPILFCAFVLYGAAFVLPPVILRAANHHRSGSDLLDVSARRQRPRNLAMVRSFLTEEAFNASTVLFTPGPGINRLAQHRDPAVEWFLRAPGLLLLVMILWLSARYLPPDLRNLSVLLAAVPLIGFSVLSVVGRTRYTTAFERACLPSWILLELTLFVLLGNLRDGEAVLSPNTRKVLAGVAGAQILLFIWVPISAARELWRIPARPDYEITSNALYDPELSRLSSRGAINRIRQVTNGPEDVVVPATYSDRAFGTDTWIELNGLGRLLPLNIMPFALEFTQGDGANFLGRTPFTTSRRVRVVVIAPDPYRRADFSASVERIKNRFVQARQWVRSVPDGRDAFDIWTADIECGEYPGCKSLALGTH